MLIGGGNLLRRRLRGRAAGTAIVADIGHVIGRPRSCFVDVGDRHVRNIVDRPVVEERAVSPIAALVADTVSSLSRRLRRRKSRFAGPA